MGKDASLDFLVQMVPGLEAEVWEFPQCQRGSAVSAGAVDGAVPCNTAVLVLSQCNVNHGSDLCQGKLQGN